jgi:hypothetical protein
MLKPRSSRVAARRSLAMLCAAGVGAIVLAAALASILSPPAPAAPGTRQSRPGGAPSSRAARVKRSRTHRRTSSRTHHRRTKLANPLPLKMIWGPTTLPNGASAFPVYHRLGAQVLELQLSWRATAPTRPSEPANPADPAYIWPASLERAAAEASAYGIDLAVMVKGSPSWANGGQGPSWAPENPADYAAFMQAVSRRFPSIHYWMIWGEVTRSGNFNPMPPNSPVGPQRYALLLEAAYGALKAVNPANMVIGGATYTVGLDSPSEYLRWLRLPDGAPPRMDFYSHNPYSTRFPRLAKPYSPAVRDIDDIGTLDSEVKSAYAGHGPAPKLWLSEFGISSDTANRAFDYFVSRREQAKWVTAAFKLVDSLPYVAGLGWYELLDEPASIPEHITEGLMTAEGRPKPAFYAYAHAP